jgi:endonuclease YncB( thermonuclease family)
VTATRSFTCSAFLFVAATYGGVAAETLRGDVVHVADGDTITVLDAAKRKYRVRVAGIDAPERRQANYETSRQHLTGLAFGKAVIIEWHKRDQYGRLVGKIEANGKDVGLEQLRAGQAWWFRQYASEQSALDRSQYESAELEARINQRGLWRAGKPLPPWEWRSTKGVQRNSSGEPAGVLAR